jgi:hypothetical protein
VGLTNGGSQQIGRDEEDLQKTRLAFLSNGQGRQYSRPERTEVESVAAIGESHYFRVYVSASELDEVMDS